MLPGRSLAANWVLVGAAGDGWLVVDDGATSGACVGPVVEHVGHVVCPAN